MAANILKHASRRALGEERFARVALQQWNLRQLASFTVGSSRESRLRLERFRDQHLGERCVIIGNGPSLNKTDLSRISDVPTFGLNRIYLAFDIRGFVTSYLVCMNPFVLEQWGEEFVRQQPPKFVSGPAAKGFPQRDDLILVRPAINGTFSTDPPGRGVWEGGTVTFVAMQLAYFMGFEEAILVGVDHRFSSAGPANKLVTSTSADSDHFDPSYFGPGAKWQLPDLETSERAYRMAKIAFERDGRRIVDATVEGALDVFEKRPLESLFP